MKYILSNQKPIAAGFEKVVYPHPEDHNLLIKVWHPSFFERKKERHPTATKWQRALPPEFTTSD